MTNKLPVVGKRYKAKHNNKIFTAVTYLGADLDVSVRMCCNNDLLSDFTYRPKNDNFDKFFEELPEDETETKLDAITAKHWEEAGRDYFSSAEYSKIKQTRSEEINKAWYDGYKAALEVQTKPENNQTIKEQLDQCISDCAGSSIVIRELQKEIQYLSRELQNCILELSPEVKETIEELKKESLHIPFGDLKDYHYNKLKQDAETLLNALDKQFSKTPNEETLKSFSDYENKDGLTKYDSVEELFDDLEGKNS